MRARLETAASGAKMDLGPLFARLDDVIEVIEGIRDYSVEPYQQKVRQMICTTCRQDGEGLCVTRDNELCALDKYFPMIVAVIEEELNADPGLP